MILIQVLINGLITGSIYALIAASFSLIYNIVKFMDMSQGAMFVVSAFSAYAFNTLLGADLILSFVLALLVTALTSVGVNKIVYKPLRERQSDSFILLLSSFGAFLFITAVVLLFFGADVKSFDLPALKGFEIFGVIITGMQVALIVTAIGMFLVLRVFMMRTRIGKSMRAVADSRTIASTVGINHERIVTATFLLAGILAGVAGILTGLEQHLEYGMGFSAIIKGLTASVVGGVGNVPAALVGGFLIGIVENVSVWFLPSGYRDAMTFLLLIVFLVIRPQGLFGLRKRGEVIG